MWFEKKDNKDVTERLHNVELTLDKLKSKLNSLELENEDLRNKVLRKIQEKRKKIEEEEIEEVPRKEPLPGQAW